MNLPVLQYQIALTLIKGIGNISARNLVNYIGEVEGIFHQKKSQLEKIPGIGAHLSQQITGADVMKRAEKEMEFVLKNKISTAFYTENFYPYRLNECADSPVLIYHKGSISDFNTPKYIGIVGTRKASEYGKELCLEIVKQLALRHPGIVIVSGLAYGIDIHAHKAAVNNHTTTIGVLAHGLDRIYPAAHRSTAVRMIGNGGLLTEYPSETTPEKQNFVQRNRIIAGLVDAVIVVESAEKGGSLITADIANSYNRDVFAFPGKSTDTASKGCNKLIKTHKANLIESVEDIELLMGWEQNNPSMINQPSLFPELSDEEQYVVNGIRSQQPIHINLLSKQVDMPIGELVPLLIELEFKNIIKCLPGNLYACRGSLI